MDSLGRIPDLAPSSLGYDEASSASSGQKRKRENSPSQNTNAFTVATRRLVCLRTNPDVCWNCEGQYVEFCHVVGRRDPAIIGMEKKGMITFGTIGDYRNAILLCPTCHRAFDQSSYMGWVFLPIDLEFFIEWEKQDFAQRQAIVDQGGRPPNRAFPDEKDYEDYMRTMKRLQDPDDGLCRGGLYNRYLLDEKVFPWVMMDGYRRLGLQGIPGCHPDGPKRWHGAPMAAINRGFHAMGSSWRRLPKRESHQLFELQGLYSEEPSKTRAEATTTDTQGVLIPHESDASASHSTNTQQTSGHAAAEGGPTMSVAEAVKMIYSANHRRACSGQEVIPHEPEASVSQLTNARQTLDNAAAEGGPTMSVAEAVKMIYSTNPRTACSDQRDYDSGIDTMSKGIKRSNDSIEHEERGRSRTKRWCFGPASTSDHKVKIHTAQQYVEGRD